MRKHPKVLWVESGSLSLLDTENGSLTHLLDMHGMPHWLRKIEEMLRLDFSTSLQAKFTEDQCDIVCALSEKVGIPLSFMSPRKPLVVIAHHMSSPLKAKFAKALGIVNKWSGIGYISDEGREFIIDYFGVNPDRLFQWESSKYLDKAALLNISYDGSIMSVGVAKRDYNTLIKALVNLPGCNTELFMSSKFGDRLKDQVRAFIPKWVNIMGWVSEDELVNRYQSARFVVVPLHDTTHSGAGINAVLEAGAFYKAVIATNTGGMPTFVKHGETGILVPPHDVNALQNEIHKLWTQPALAKEMGCAGRRYIESRFNPQDVNAKFFEFLENLYKS